MKITILYVGSSLLAPLKNAEREINRAHNLDLRVAAYNFGSPLSDLEWQDVETDLKDANVVFVIHVMDGENATRLVAALENFKQHHDAVVVINCMPELMRRTRLGRLDISTLGKRQHGKGAQLLKSVGSWVGSHAKRGKSSRGHGQYLKLVDRLPGILKFVPTAGALTDAKHYLYLFCFFLQPTPANIKSMLLYALVHYVRDERLKKISVPKPEQMPSVAIYHPSAPALFRTFAEYRKWYRKPLNAESTIGLLLMRPQVISKTTNHYDALIKAIEAEGLSVIPAIATLMDNREAVSQFFVEPAQTKARVSQIVSLTGFSFVGGPAMNDSAAASQFLRELNLPYRSAVSLDTQTIEAWSDSQTGLNPVQAGMQIAIPEIDGATEPFIYGGIPSRGQEPVALQDRCTRLARRLRRWNKLQGVPRDQIKLAIVLFCFPPNKGNIGTAADLDVFPGVFDVLKRLRDEGYRVDLPDSADDLRAKLIGGNSERFAAPANIAYSMNVQEYRRLCPYIRDVEEDWGAAPGAINSLGNELLIQGLELGNVFIGVQPTFGFEGDPMRLMMARSGSPHHGFMAFYTYVSKVFNADGVIHFGTHGALEFMPGKQIGLSGECWPDRLIDELPNFYIYSVNNPSEGSIAKRRSYAELISYLTPPIENAGLYKELASLKDLVMAYRQSTIEQERIRLYESIEELTGQTHLSI
ncbi:MAG TPA: cobaltochelatase subunit CobN [Pyrinomonadaceae bacterium]|nr:cobaltochelatase subunit CobN [Pyrinomonadaceae bacterium]